MGGNTYVRMHLDSLIGIIVIPANPSIAGRSRGVHVGKVDALALIEAPDDKIPVPRIDCDTSDSADRVRCVEDCRQHHTGVCHALSRPDLGQNSIHPDIGFPRLDIAVGVVGAAVDDNKVGLATNVSENF